MSQTGKVDNFTAFVEENVLAPVDIGDDLRISSDEGKIATGDVPDLEVDELVALREWEQTDASLGVVVDGSISYREASVLARETAGLPASPLTRALQKIERGYAKQAERFFYENQVDGFQYVPVGGDPMIRFKWTEDGLSFSHIYGARLYVNWDAKRDVFESESRLETDNIFGDVLSIRENPDDSWEWQLKYWTSNLGQQDLDMTELLTEAVDKKRAADGTITVDDKKVADEAIFLERVLDVKKYDSGKIDTEAKITASRKFLKAVIEFHLDPSRGGIKHLAEICSEMWSPTLAALVYWETNSINQRFGEALLWALKRIDPVRAEQIKETLDKTEVVAFDWEFLSTGGGKKVWNAKKLSEDEVKTLGDKGKCLPPKSKNPDNPLEEIEREYLVKWESGIETEKSAIDKIITYHNSSPDAWNGFPSYFADTITLFAKAYESGDFTPELPKKTVLARGQYFNWDTARIEMESASPYGIDQILYSIKRYAGSKLSKSEESHYELYHADALEGLLMQLRAQKEPWAENHIGSLIDKVQDGSLNNRDLEYSVRMLSKNDKDSGLWSEISKNIMKGLVAQGTTPKYYWIEDDSSCNPTRAISIRKNSKPGNTAEFLHFRHLVETSEGQDSASQDAPEAFMPVWRAYRGEHEPDETIAPMRLVILDPTQDRKLVHTIDEDARSIERDYAPVIVKKIEIGDEERIILLAERGERRKTQKILLKASGVGTEFGVSFPEYYLKKKYMIDGELDEKVEWNGGVLSYASQNYEAEIDAQGFTEMWSEGIDVDLSNSLPFSIFQKGTPESTRFSGKSIPNIREGDVIKDSSETQENLISVLGYLFQTIGPDRS